MINVTSVAIAAVTLVIWATIWFAIVPGFVRTSKDWRESQPDEREKRRRLKKRLAYVAIVVWVWIIALIALTGGLHVQRNLELLTIMVFVTVILWLVARATLRSP